MTYFDINGKEHILDKLTVSKPEDLIHLLIIINKYDRISQSDLRRESKFSLGKIYPSVKTLKAAKLVDNGNGLKINEFGKKFLFTYNHDKEAFKPILKNSFLNLPIFFKIYEKNKEVTDHKTIFELFKKELDGKYKGLNDRFIGSAVRRYLEGIFDIKLKSGAGVNIIDKSKINEKRSYKSKKSNNNIILILKDFKKELNLSKEEMIKVIDSLPNEKKDEILSKIFSEVI